MKIQSEFVVTKWEEVNVSGYFPDSPMTRASVEYTSSGSIQGVFHVEYIIHTTGSNLAANQVSTYVGYLEFTGRIGDKTGMFVLMDIGEYANGMPSGSLAIKPASGTGDFTGIQGTGKYYVLDSTMIMELDYSVEDDVENEDTQAEDSNDTSSEEWTDELP